MMTVKIIPRDDSTVSCAQRMLCSTSARAWSLDVVVIAHANSREKSLRLFIYTFLALSTLSLSRAPRSSSFSAASMGVCFVAW